LRMTRSGAAALNLRIGGFVSVGSRSIEDALLGGQGERCERWSRRKQTPAKTDVFVSIFRSSRLHRNARNRASRTS
jgi:hypothetical protein